jgi:hypothetical protein
MSVLARPAGEIEFQPLGYSGFSVDDFQSLLSLKLHIVIDADGNSKEQQKCRDRH